METTELIKRAKTGDKDALVKLIMHKQQEYYKLAYVYTKNKDDAVDALSEMIVIIYDSISKLRKPSAFYSWSKTILVNCCKDILRQKKRVVLSNDIEQESSTNQYEIKDKELLVLEHLSRLDDKHGETIRLRYFMDYDYQSIADTLQIPLGTVKSRIANGLRKLRESLGGELV